jgi:TolB protein
MKTRASIVTVIFVLLIIMIGCETPPPTRVDTFWDTSLLQNVVRITDDTLVKSWARISPDGKMLLYCETSRMITRANYAGVYNYWNIMLLRDVNVPAKTPVLPDYAYAPSWYENGSAFLYSVNERGGSRIVRSAVAGGGRTYISRYPIGGGDSGPAIRGDTILCDTEINGRRQIISMKDNGMDITVLGDGHSPFWHPNPRVNKYLFIRNGDVFEMDLGNLHQATQIFGDLSYNCEMPSYSPDGQYIIFQKGAVLKRGARAPQGAAGQQARWQIFIVKADGTGLSALTVADVDSYSPSWDVNNFIYFVSNASGNTEIYRARISFN